MNNLSFLLLFFLSSSILGQSYYSSITNSEDYVAMDIGHFNVDGYDYIVSQEYCVYTTGELDCSYINRVIENGELERIVNLGDILLRKQCAISNDDGVIIVGKDSPEILSLMRFDKSFTLIEKHNYNINYNAYIFSIRDGADAIYISSRDFNSESNSGFKLRFFRVSKDNYDLQELEYSIDHSNNTVSDFEINTDGELCLLSQAYNRDFILKYDTELNLISKHDIDDSEFEPYLNIEVLKNGQYAIGFKFGKELVCYESDNLNPQWSIDVAQAFGVNNIGFLRQMKQLENGDILLCGHINHSGFNSFVCRVSSSGSIVWKRIYKYPNAERSLLLDFEEDANGDLSLFGLIRLGGENWNSYYNQYWVLKIDSDGCLLDDCGNVEIKVIDFDGDGYYSDVDCNDNLAIVNPGQEEIPGNGLDDDCNDETLDFPVDNDNDGYDTNSDCDDNNPFVNPGQTEIVGNNIDDDCNQNTPDYFDDLDNDGFFSDVDCDDGNDLVNPGQVEVLYNGIDDDCNENTLDDDLDMDGFSMQVDCDDTDYMINPNAIEIPGNGIDENCDGLDEISTSVTDLEVAVSVFPNPFTSSISVISINSGIRVYDVQIFDSVGRRLFSQSINFELIELNAFDNGVFIISINTNKGVCNKKIVKI